MISKNPRKQRKKMFNAPLHMKRKWISAHLEENLLLKYDKRAVPAIKGDTVRVMRGSFRGHEDKIVKVNVKKRFIEIEGITMSKADGNKIAKPIHSSNVIITKLNLTDKWRRKKLERGLSEDTKKEIEAEAKEQIKIAEEERKKEEEAKVLEEKEETIEEEAEEPKDKEKPEEKKQESKVEKKSAPKPEIKKEEPKKTAKTVKKAPESKSPKKSTAKKTPVKSTKKKGETK
ncbi:MAG: 50S ribosomal protein L24 [Thermoplasmatales archaeon]|nr:MAG: 50S ribosomal protein L24 [Thermoplasmatales archaeon]